MTKVREISKLFETLNKQRTSRKKSFLNEYFHEDIMFEYSPEEFDKFIQELAALYPFSGHDYFNSPSIAIQTDRTSSSVVFSGEELLQAWNNLKQKYAHENPMFFVWLVKGDTSGITNQHQRYELIAILEALKRRQKITRIGISMASEANTKAGEENSRQGGLDEAQPIQEINNSLNPIAVKAFLLNAKREFERVQSTLLTGEFEDVRKWAMNKVQNAQIFSHYEPNQLWGIASNLVLFVLDRPSPFDQFLPQNMSGK